MSCYLCTEQHINYLVSQVENLTSRRDSASFAHDGARVYIQRGFDETPYSAQSVTLQGLVEALRTENMASFSSRYPHEDDVIQPFAYKRQFRNEANDFTAHLAEVASALRCFEYQACEHPGWEESIGHSFLRGLEDMVLRKLQDIHGTDYESSQGEWRPAA